MGQEQIKKTPQKHEEPEAVIDIGVAAVASEVDVEDLLKEIDGVLEENAEEFVRGYVQKGGE